MSISKENDFLSSLLQILNDSPSNESPSLNDIMKNAATTAAKIGQKYNKILEVEEGQKFTNNMDNFLKNFLKPFQMISSINSFANDTAHLKDIDCEQSY